MTIELTFEEDWSDTFRRKHKSLRMFRVFDVSVSRWYLDSLKDFDFTFVVLGLGFCVTFGFPDKEVID